MTSAAHSRQSGVKCTRVAYNSRTGWQVLTGFLKNKTDNNQQIPFLKGGKGWLFAARAYQRETLNINLTNLSSQQQEVKDRLWGLGFNLYIQWGFNSSNKVRDKGEIMVSALSSRTPSNT